jgi:glyoxylase-like metal-dependent hydrolase (beta-lactamase superfamily II)
MKPVIFAKNAASINTYLLIYKKKCIAIDPGFNGEALQEYIELNDLTLTDVFLTHGHYDHIRDIRILAKKWDFNLYIHELDQAMLYDDKLNYAVYFNGSFRIKSDQKITLLHDGDLISHGTSHFKVWHTPGHTQGSLCLEYLNMIFTGDTLFCGDLGRTDLMGGSQKAMNQSIIRLFRGISNDLIVYPGHEQSTSMSIERKENPAVIRLLKTS